MCARFVIIFSVLALSGCVSAPRHAPVMVGGDHVTDASVPPIPATKVTVEPQAAERSWIPERPRPRPAVFSVRLQPGPTPVMR